MDKFLEKFNLPKLNQEEIKVMENAVTNIEIKTVIKVSHKTKSHCWIASQGNSIKKLEKS